LKNRNKQISNSKPPQNRKLTLGILSVGHGVTHLADASFNVFLPYITTTLGLTNFQIGIVASTRQVGFGIVNLPGGIVVDMVKSHWGLILTACLVWTALFYGLMGMSQSYKVFIVLVFVTALPGALWHLPAAAAISQRFPDWRGFAISIHGLGANVGNIAGPLVAGGLLSFMIWRGVLLIYACPVLVASIFVWAYLKNIGKDLKSEQPRTLKGQLRMTLPILKNPIIIGLVFVALLRGMALNSMFVWTPFYLDQTVGLSSFNIGFHMALLSGMGVLSTPLLGNLSDRFNRKAILLPGLALSGILSALVLHTGTGFSLTLLLGGMGLFSYALHQIIQAAVLDEVDTGTEASAIGILFGFTSVLGAFSPLLASWIVESYGLGYVFYYQSILSIGSFLLLILIPIKRSVVPVLNEETGSSNQ
jgi:MFS family permease